jgi:hypothetical protein
VVDRHRLSGKCVGICLDLEILEHREGFERLVDFKSKIEGCGAR